MRCKGDGSLNRAGNGGCGGGLAGELSYVLGAARGLSCIGGLNWNWRNWRHGKRGWFRNTQIIRRWRIRI